MENELKAPVNKIIPFSNVDGPGNRMSIFFQSCPFKCLYCHNPETINYCINCGECIKTCPVNALSFKDKKVVWNPEICVNCDTCIHTCKHLASPKITYMTSDEIISKIAEVRPFIRGITVSGGECMNQAPFLLELFRKLRKKDPELGLLIDSNGFCDYQDYEELISLSDGVMLDIKAFDNSFHKYVCSVSNEIVLKNLDYLLKIDKLEEVRTVVLPNRSEENEYTVTNVSKIIQDKCRYKLLKYRYFGVRDEGISAFGRVITSDEEVIRLRRIALNNGASKTVII